MKHPQSTPPPTRGRLTDEDFAALAARNDERLAAAREALGPKYLCHRANFIARRDSAPAAAAAQTQPSLIH